MKAESIHKLVRPLHRAVLATVTRGTVLASAADGLRVRLKLALRAGEVADDVELLESYGFTSVPLPDRDGVLTLAVGGNGAHRVALAAGGRKHRPRDLEPGEVCLYNDLGDRVTFRRDRTIEVTAGTAVDITAPLVHITGDLHVDGEVRDHTSTMQAMRDTYNGHDHDGDSGGHTSGPSEAME